MKLQDKYPYDSSIVGLDNVYHPIGAYSHYVNSEQIQIPHRIITKGKRYVIASISPHGSDAIVHKIRLLDVYYNKGLVYLFVMDLNSERVYIVDLCLECTEDKCQWVLYDLKDYDILKDYSAIKSYCRKGKDAKENTDVESEPHHSHDDLLEFEF
jgi:hypothetical protein